MRELGFACLQADRGRAQATSSSPSQDNPDHVPGPADMVDISQGERVSEERRLAIVRVSASQSLSMLQVPV